MKTLEQLKEYYNNLSNDFEGYIQMSDEKLNKVFEEKQALPKWDDIHNTKNFILESCLFDGDRSITIRQVNNGFMILDKNLSDFSEGNITTQTFLTTGYSTLTIAQIWEEDDDEDDEDDENCMNLKVLKPTIQLFIGFNK